MLAPQASAGDLLRSVLGVLRSSPKWQEKMAHPRRRPGMYCRSMPVAMPSAELLGVAASLPPASDHADEADCPVG